MTTPWRHRLRRARFALWAVFASVVIVLAVLGAVAQLVLPWIVHNPKHVEAWLSQRLDRPVTIGSVSSAWVEGGPQLTLNDVRIGSGGAGPALAVPRAELAVKPYAPLIGRAWNEFRLVGLDLELVRGADGTWHMHGLQDGGTGTGGVSMGALRTLTLGDLRVRLRDDADHLDLRLAASELRVENHDNLIRVLGKVQRQGEGAPALDVVTEFTHDFSSGRIWFGAQDLDLARALEGFPLTAVRVLSGHGVLQFWTQWQDSRVVDVHAKLDLQDLILDTRRPLAADAGTDLVPRTHLDRLAFVARLQRTGADWTFDVADLVFDDAPPARLTIAREESAPLPRYRAGAQDLQLAPLANFALLSDAVPAGLRRWLYLASPRGRIASAQLRMAGAADYAIQAALDGIGFSRVGVAPGVDSLDARIDGDAEAIELALPTQALALDFSGVFRKPFVFSQLGGNVLAWRTDDAWRLDTDQLDFEGEGYGGQARGGVELPDDHSRPRLDVYALVRHAEVPAAKLFWPMHIMPPSAIEWLDHALVSGNVTSGRAVLRGDLADWPFHNNAGHFDALANVSDLTLDYHPDWPRAEHVDAAARFVNTGMQVEATAGQSKGIRVSEADASIADFGDAVLALAVKGGGTGPTLLSFLRASPIGKRYLDQLKELSVGGKGDVAFDLNLPLDHMDTMALAGSVNLSAANLDHRAYDLHFTDANGKIAFSQGGFDAEGLAVKYESLPARLALAVGDRVADPAHAFEGRLSGTFPTATVLARVPVLLPVLPKFPGAAPWRVAVDVSEATTTTPVRTRLSVDSDLKGVAIDLPAPLAKPADAAWSLHFGVDLPYAGQTFTANVDDRLAVQGRLPRDDEPIAIRAQFGVPEAPPPTQGILIGGRIAQLDGAGWIELAHSSVGGAAPGLVQEINVDVDDLTFSDRHFANTRIKIEASAPKTEITLDGAALAGQISLPGQNLATAGITARLQLLHWPDAPAGAPEDDTSVLAAVVPASLPPLHVWIGDLKVGSARLGEVVAESRPVAGGMRIDKFTATSPNVVMRASGDWSGSASANRTHMAIELDAHDLGKMLDAFGFSGLIEGGKTTARIDGAWDGPPLTFALTKTDGTLHVDVGEGRILEVEPGAGRIFGLLSLREIPRRLSLDFSDFFKSGLGFSSIIGTFRLDNGNAYTDDLRIKSPAAEIVITGRTGLRAKDYDQQMIVTPHAGATLPVVGAIAGGPVGAAAGLVIQGLLSKPIGEATGSHYHVGGTWEKPVITLKAKEKAKPAKAASGRR